MDPNPLDLRNCLCAGVRKTDRALTRLYDQTLRPTGLTASQFALLSVLQEAEPLRITDLARVMVMDQTTVTRNVELLKKGGLVATVTAQDQRTREVAMTDLGRRSHSEAVPLWTQVQGELTRGLGPGRFARFLEDLSVIRGLMNPKTKEET